jgi:hypothetical protein
VIREQRSVVLYRRYYSAMKDGCDLPHLIHQRCKLGWHDRLWAITKGMVRIVVNLYD